MKNIFKSCILCHREVSDNSVYFCSDCASGVFSPEVLSCPCCLKPLVSEKGLCLICRESVKFSVPHYSLFYYNDTIRILLREMKLHGVTGYRKYFSEKLKIHLIENYNKSSIIFTTVPSRTNSLFLVEKILLEALSGLDLKYEVILKRVSEVQQKGLSRDSRMRAIQTKYEILKKTDKPVDLILFDDISTTGSTLKFCSELLVKNGYNLLSTICLAQVNQAC